MPFICTATVTFFIFPPKPQYTAGFSGARRAPVVFFDDPPLPQSQNIKNPGALRAPGFPTYAKMIIFVKGQIAVADSRGVCGFET